MPKSADVEKVKSNCQLSSPVFGEEHISASLLDRWPTIAVPLTYLTIFAGVVSNSDSGDAN